MRNPTKSQTLLMRELDEGRPIEEIADRLGKSVGAVKLQITRIRRRVRDGHIAPGPYRSKWLPVSREIYLAGFDFFRPDAVAYDIELKRLRRERDFVGFYPLDFDVSSPLPSDQATQIYDSNIMAIRSADLVMANLNDFRGPGELDSGTAFEIGFAAALKKPVWAYRSDDAALLERAASTRHPTAGNVVCEQGYVVEDFGLSINLMLACSVRLVVGGAAECLDEIKAALVADGMRGRPLAGDGVCEA